MPKMKTKRAARKRLKVTGTGKLMRRRLRDEYWRDYGRVI